MSNVIDLQAKRKEKTAEIERRNKELEKRRRFILSKDEANILINSYINYINTELEDFQEYITEEDKAIGKNEIKTVFSLLKMVFKKYKSSNHYGDIVMNWNYKNLYYSIMAIYAGIEVEPYENLEREEKIERNLYYRLLELDQEIAKVVHGPAVQWSELPSWLREQELIIENDLNAFKQNYTEEFLDKVVLMEEDRKGVYYVRSCPARFRSVLLRLRKRGNAEYCVGEFPKGWRIHMAWDRLVEELNGLNLELISLQQQEVEEVTHKYSIELLEEHIADMINRMECLGIQVNSAFLYN